MKSCLLHLSDDLEPSIIKIFIPFVEFTKKLKSSYRYCQACCSVCNVLSGHSSPEYQKLLSETINRLEGAWNSLDLGWTKLNTGYQIASALAKKFPDLAIKYMEFSEKLRGEIILTSKTPAEAYLACLRLAIRVYVGLFPKNLQKDYDIERLSFLIDQVPSNGIRISLWADLATRCYINKHEDECKDIVAKHIRPFLESISDDDFKHQIIIDVAPALYSAHKSTTIELLEKIPEEIRELAICQICDFILYKKSPHDPCDSLPGKTHLITYQEAIDICELLNLINTDTLIYSYIKDVMDNILSKENKTLFVRNEKADIAERLKRVIESKLPDKKNIKHEGFKIIALSQVTRVYGGPSDWENLINQARDIKNISDKAFVLSLIAANLPSKMESKREQIIQEAEDIISSIPSDLDRMNRYMALAEEIINVDPQISKRCLKSAMEFSYKIGDPDELVHIHQKRILDLAHRIDPDYASSLVPLIDDDPARISIRASLKHHVKVLDTKKRMVDSADIALDTKIKHDYAQASWMNLKALNSGRIQTLSYEQTKQYFNLISEMSFPDSYPVLAWFTENIIKRCSKTEQAITYIPPLFEATLLGAEFAGQIANRSIGQLNLVKKNAAIAGSTGTINSTIIRENEREKAINYISEWFGKSVKNYLIICDPFFGVEDLDLLPLLNSLDPTCKITIVTSRKQQKELSQPWEEAYSNYWHINISDQDPPKTDIVIIGVDPHGDSPIHDRWWITKGSGLKLGTSFNSIGRNKVSEISIMSTEEAETHDMEINQYLKHEKIVHNGEKIRYLSFVLT